MTNLTARALITCTPSAPCCYDHTCLNHQGFAAALLAVEQRVWEESAVYLDTEAKRFDHVDDGEAHMIRAFAAWCRAQAKEAAQGREKDES